MSADYFFSLKTIGMSKVNGRKPQSLMTAARHNRREIQAEMGASGHIDASRTCLNETLAGIGTAAGVVALATALMAENGIDADKLRKDYCQAIELLFSLPATTTIDTGEYFRHCVAWAASHFEASNILSADVHRDEDHPHLHILVMPLLNGKMSSSALTDLKARPAMFESFYRKVAQGYGLKKPAKRMMGAARVTAVQAVHQALQTTQDAILQSSVWEVVQQAIERDPAPFMAVLGIKATPPKLKPLKQFVDYVVSTGKGGKTERRSKPLGIEKTNPKRNANPIGIENRLEKHQSLTCVGIESKAPAISRPTSPLATVTIAALPATQAAPSRAAIARQAMQAGAARHQVKPVVVAPGDDCVRVRDPDFDLSAWEHSTEPTSFHSQH